MKTTLISIVITTMFLSSLLAQEELPYRELVTKDDELYTSGSVAARMIDGLGFRFYWATEALRKVDLEYKPTKDARSTMETINHIYEMSVIIRNATERRVNTGPEQNLSFDEIRKSTLLNLKAASDILRKSTPEEMQEFKAMFKRGQSIIERPFWNLINGPIEDCVWHVGQIVSFRRASGNPFSDKVSLFSGTVNK